MACLLVCKVIFCNRSRVKKLCGVNGLGRVQFVVGVEKPDRLCRFYEFCIKPSPARVLSELFFVLQFADSAAAAQRLIIFTPDLLRKSTPEGL